ncbi:hypothetical protein HPP92_003687, partial [Vanilla planifolia]
YRNGMFEVAVATKPNAWFGRAARKPCSVWKFSQKHPSQDCLQRQKHYGTMVMKASGGVCPQYMWKHSHH